MEYIKGLVSVVIPTYKRNTTVNRAVKSVLLQTYKKIECIVVNDNNPGDKYSESLYNSLNEIKDERLRIINQPNHKNGAAARNYGIKNARGEYIAFLDDDDWWKSDKVEKQIERFNCLDNSFAVVTTLVEFYKEGKIIRKTLPYKTTNAMLSILEREIEVTTPSVMVRHSCIDEIGSFDENLKRHQEIQFLAYMTKKYNLSLVCEYLTCVGIEDMQNKPSLEQMKSIKKDFFISVDPLIKGLPKKEQNCIIELHRFEIVYRKLQDKLFLSAMKDLISILKSPMAINKVFKRVLRRLMESKTEK